MQTSLDVLIPRNKKSSYIQAMQLNNVIIFYNSEPEL